MLNYILDKHTVKMWHGSRWLRIRRLWRWWLQKTETWWRYRSSIHFSKPCAWNLVLLKIIIGLQTFKYFVRVLRSRSHALPRVSHCTAQWKIRVSEDRKLSSHGREYLIFEEAFICLHRAILLQINIAAHTITMDFNGILWAHRHWCMWCIMNFSLHLSTNFKITAFQNLKFSLTFPALIH
jgi:hypothetical protein